MNEAILKFGYSKKQKNDEIPFSPYRLIFHLNRKKNKAIFLKDNLSEYTLDSIPFGTNWKQETKVDEPNDYTGFRCVCEIIE